MSLFRSAGAERGAVGDSTDGLTDASLSETLLAAFTAEVEALLWATCPAGGVAGADGFDTADDELWLTGVLKAPSVWFRVVIAVDPELLLCPGVTS